MKEKKSHKDASIGKSNFKMRRHFDKQLNIDFVNLIRYINDI